MADELSEAAKGTKTIRFLEASEKGLLDIVIGLIEEDKELLKFQEEETGQTALHKAAKTGQLDVAKALLEAGMDPNLDDVNLETCLHVAARTYAEDETGDFAFEDIIVALVAGGALAFKNRDKKMPDPGEDAGTAVEKALGEAERKGKAEAAERDKLRKENGYNAFDKALVKHLTNASTCVGVVGVKSFNEPGSTGK